MSNEKGITLIELLASITILLIISSLIYGVLIGINKNYSQNSAKSNMEQEANFIISTIKNYHQQYSTYQLSYNPGGKIAKIGITSASNQLESNDFDIILKVGITNYSTYANFPGDAASEDITTAADGTIYINVHSSTPINIDITLVNKQSGQSYEVDTIINRY